MVKKSGKSSNKGKTNNIGKIFIKRENNNTWIMLGLVLVLCVAVYYYVTSKNNDRTEEKFESPTTTSPPDSMCGIIESNILANGEKDILEIEIHKLVNKIIKDNDITTQRIPNENITDELKSMIKQYLKITNRDKYENSEPTEDDIKHKLFQYSSIGSDGLTSFTSNNTNINISNEYCENLKAPTMKCNPRDDVKTLCVEIKKEKEEADKLLNSLRSPSTTQATTTTQAQVPATTQAQAPATTQAQAPATTQAQAPATTQAEATTTTQAEATTTTQAQAPASNNANELSTETQEMYQRVRNEIALLYNNASGELSDFLKEGLKSLTPSQRKSLCNSYCTSFTPCTELCKLTECSNCTGDALGDTDMSGMGLPNTSLGYAGVDDQYVLLDNIDDNTAGLNVKANLENLGNKSLVGPHIVQKDTNGISNIFAPYIIMTPKRKNETYGTYLLEDPNDPFQKRFVESVLANY